MKVLKIKTNHKENKETFLSSQIVSLGPTCKEAYYETTPEMVVKT